MRFSISFFVLLVVVACHDRSNKELTESTKSARPTTDTSISTDTLCFRQILKRDTTTLRLMVTGRKVKGYLDINPYEKDRARGPVEGTLTGNQIHADWDRAGEGVGQQYALDFTLKGNAISWREGERTKKQGVWVLKQPSRSYEYVLNKADCK